MKSEEEEQPTAQGRQNHISVAAYCFVCSSTFPLINFGFEDICCQIV